MIFENNNTFWLWNKGDIYTNKIFKMVLKTNKKINEFPYFLKTTTKTKRFRNFRRQLYGLRRMIEWSWVFCVPRNPKHFGKVSVKHLDLRRIEMIWRHLRGLSVGEWFGDARRWSAVARWRRDDGGVGPGCRVVGLKNRYS